MSRRPHPAAIGFLVLAALIMALGAWAQVQQYALSIARADAVVTQGAAGFYTVPVPFVLKPFEAGLVPVFLFGPDGQGTIFGAMAKIGGAFGVLGLLFLSLRGRSVAELDMDSQEETDAEDIYEAPAIPEVAPKYDWQKRLAQKMAAEPMPVEKQKRARSGFGRSLYRAVLMLVGLAFLGLAAVALIGSGYSFDNLDIPGMRSQITTTVQQAIAGDQTAVIGVAKVAAVVIGILIVLRVLIFRRKPVKRRDFATLG